MAISLTSTMDTFTRAYVECALWSESAELGDCNECGAEAVLSDENEKCSACHIGRLSGTDASFDSHGYTASNVDPDSLRRMILDCLRFQVDFETELELWDEYGRGPDKAGHDFWLSRNGHGTGFWDRFMDGDERQAVGDKLQAGAKAYGEVSLYLGDEAIFLS